MAFPINKFRKRRVELGLSRAAWEPSVSRRTIEALEQGRRKSPSFDVIQSLAAKLDVPMDFFVGPDIAAKKIKRGRPKKMVGNSNKGE